MTPPIVMRPPWLFETTWIYHITAVENLPGILKAGRIHATNQLRTRSHVSIANNDIQNRRARTQVPFPPYGVLHDYVPLYFAPRSPMLFVNDRGGIANARPQERIVHLVTTAQRIHQQGLPYVFTDRHAITSFAECFSDIRHLDKIEWDLFFEAPLTGEYSTYWQVRYDDRNPKWVEREEIRQAEFLVYNTLRWEHILEVGVKNAAVQQETMDILRRFGIETLVNVRPDWYY